MEVIKKLPKLTAFSIEFNYHVKAPVGEDGRMEFIFDKRKNAYQLPQRIVNLEKRLNQFDTGTPSDEYVKLLKRRTEVVSKMTNQELAGLFDNLQKAIDELPKNSRSQKQVPLNNLRSYLTGMEDDGLDAESMTGGTHQD